jgi:HEPN domain-containing protein
MSDRSRDWLRQEQRDLDSARAQKQDGFFEWACFIAQQASEKALKALLHARGVELWGHSLIKIVGILKTDIFVY